MRTFRIQSRNNARSTTPVAGGVVYGKDQGRSSGSRFILRAPSQSFDQWHMPFVLAYSGGPAGDLHPSSLSSPCGHRDQIFGFGTEMHCLDSTSRPEMSSGVAGSHGFPGMPCDWWNARLPLYSSARHDGVPQPPEQEQASPRAFPSASLPSRKERTAMAREPMASRLPTPVNA